MLPSFGNGSFLQAPMQIHESVDRLVLTQGSSTAFKIITVVLVLFFAFCALATYGIVFGSQTRKVVCDRAADTCTRDGNLVAQLGEVSGAELRKSHVFKQGDFYLVTLLMKDGTTRDVSDISAQSDASITEYRAAVDQLRAFLADATQARMETTFTYRGGVWEKARMLFGFVLFAPFVLLALMLWSSSTVTFDRAAQKIIGAQSRLLRGTTTNELRFDQIQSVEAESVRGSWIIELKLADGSRAPLVFAKESEVPATLVPSLRTITGKN